jgi:N-acetyl-gamma-glutamyl-phosphate reductase
MTVRVAIAGASGYAGGEVARLLVDHPEVSVGTLGAHSSAGALVTSVHPHLVSYRGRVFEETTLETLRDHDVVVIALPHGQSGALGEQLLASGNQQLVIDLGADRRLTDNSAWDQFYGGAYHQPFVYGMPELPVAEGPAQRELIRQATAVAAPGCNATAVTLALAPLIHAGLVASTDIQAVLAVGPSGAGRVMRSDLLGAELMSSANPYAVGGVHRHIPEIAQNLKRAGASEVSLSLTPVLVPMSRGILATCTALRTGLATVDEIYQALTDVYAHEPYLQVLDPGLLPRTKDVLGSNTVSLGVAIDEAVNRVIVVAAVDNLVKGTAGAAIQSLNLVCGFPETTGLSQNGVAP